ncbi:MAG TPA: pantoate--beta-alanine ligase [Hyphomicrobiaceae bacterium]|nr:pantoate--beta-alanine ligase [Hyphomicrobiaceae bacterium]
MASCALKVVRTVKDVRQAVASWRREGETVALVPTMGALHEGHLALVRLAKKRAPRAVVSIFVNPTQFAPGEDLGRYPRDEAGDVAKLEAVGADLVWAPDQAEMYPPGFATPIEPGGAALELEGRFRPHHFGGVATVCLKLFSAVAPDLAVFGEKDYQQLTVIRQMVRDLALPLAIVAAPTVREKDGLALSSRNAYLSPAERAAAPALYRIICEVAAKVAAGTQISDETATAKRDLERAGFTKVDYVEVRDAETLAPLDPSSGRPGRVLAAAWLGTTRLIDNVAV